MEKTTADFFETKLKAWDKAYGLSGEARYEKEHRIPWVEMKKIIYEDICLATLGSYYQRSLYTLYRKDGETRASTGASV